MKQCLHYVIPVSASKPMTLIVSAMAEKFGFHNHLALRGVTSKTLHFGSSAKVFFPITIHIAVAHKSEILKIAQDIKEAVHVQDREIGICLMKLFYRSGLEEVGANIKEETAMPVTII